jgi:hypothetical protein
MCCNEAWAGTPAHLTSATGDYGWSGAVRFGEYGATDQPVFAQAAAVLGAAVLVQSFGQGVKGRIKLRDIAHCISLAFFALSVANLGGVLKLLYQE